MLIRYAPRWIGMDHHIGMLTLKIWVKSFEKLLEKRRIIGMFTEQSDVCKVQTKIMANLYRQCCRLYKGCATLRGWKR